ncbi:MAG: hypothetical protein IPH22_10705 [Nitrosomonas sp.]|nr:hypothetical protein [Nitrosomonas sp.]
MPLVNAQQARRALDYLVGFNLSPLLWRKIRPGLSAGRVQSPALRLIVERELEIEAFNSNEYWTVHLDSNKNHQPFTARLFQYQGKKLEQLSIGSLYTEGVDDAVEEEGGSLPPLSEGDVLPVDNLYGEQHFTQPPPRFSEASLVKALEEHGIGRPSTYATIISTLQAREYALLDKKRFVPTDVGRVVTRFLTEHFTRYVDYGFCAAL